MAAPPSKSLRDLNGTWVMNKTLSDSVEPGLALQGISWLTRKGIGLATVTLSVKEYEQDGVVHIDIQQTATGGVKGTTELRALDNTFKEHSDWLFGKVQGRSEWLTGAPLADKVGEPYLANGWEEGMTEWIHAYVESLDSGWTAEQVWGFQVVGGERRHVRNTIIKKGNKKEEMRLVYDYVPENH